MVARLRNSCPPWQQFLSGSDQIGRQDAHYRHETGCGPSVPSCSTRWGSGASCRRAGSSLPRRLRTAGATMAWSVRFQPGLMGHLAGATEGGDRGSAGRHASGGGAAPEFWPAVAAILERPGSGVVGPAVGGCPREARLARCRGGGRSWAERLRAPIGADRSAFVHLRPRERSSAERVARFSNPYPMKWRALWNSCIHGLHSPWPAGDQDRFTVRTTRSGWGIIRVTRPSSLVTPVMPAGLPLGFCG